MKRNVEFTNPSNEISNIFKAFLFESSVKQVIVLIEPFSSFVDDAFDRSFGICEIFDCSEVYFEILLFSS